MTLPVNALTGEPIGRPADQPLRLGPVPVGYQTFGELLDAALRLIDRTGDGEGPTNTDPHLTVLRRLATALVAGTVDAVVYHLPTGELFRIPITSWQDAALELESDAWRFGQLMRIAWNDAIGDSEFGFYQGMTPFVEGDQANAFLASLSVDKESRTPVRFLAKSSGEAERALIQAAEAHREKGAPIPIKAAWRAEFPISEREAERIWSRVRERFPELGAPGRRAKKPRAGKPPQDLNAAPV